MTGTTRSLIDKLQALKHRPTVASPSSPHGVRPQAFDERDKAYNKAVDDCIDIIRQHYECIQTSPVCDDSGEDGNKPAVQGDALIPESPPAKTSEQPVDSAEVERVAMALIASELDGSRIVHEERIVEGYRRYARIAIAAMNKRESLGPLAEKSAVWDIINDDLKAFALGGDFVRHSIANAILDALLKRYEIRRRG